MPKERVYAFFKLLASRKKKIKCIPTTIGKKIKQIERGSEGELVCRGNRMPKEGLLGKATAIKQEE